MSWCTEEVRDRELGSPAAEQAPRPGGASWKFPVAVPTDVGQAARAECSVAGDGGTKNRSTYPTSSLSRLLLVVITATH